MAAVADQFEGLVTSYNICTKRNLIRNVDEGTALIDAKERTLIGMSSLILGGNDDGSFPDIYLRVQPSVKWIESVMDWQL